MDVLALQNDVLILNAAVSVVRFLSCNIPDCGPDMTFITLELSTITSFSNDLGFSYKSMQKPSQNMENLVSENWP